MRSASRSIRLWHSPEIPGATLLRGDLSRHSFPRHTHDETVVGFNVGGAHSFWCRGRVHEAPPGTVALVNAGDVHTGSVLGDDGWDYRAFYVTPAYLDGVATESDCAGVGRELTVCISHDVVLTRQLLSAHHALGDGDADPLERETRVTEAFARLVALHSGQRASSDMLPSRQALARSRDFIRSQYHRTIRLSELQEISGYGKGTLIAAFRAVYGQPPYELVATLRVSDAQRRLAAGEPIARVAAAVGFTDQSHLTRQFKRIVGVTPGQYARAFDSHAFREARKTAAA